MNSTFISEPKSYGGKVEQQDNSKELARLEREWQEKYKRLESDVSFRF